MRILNTIKSSRVTAVDIETVRIIEHYKDLSDEFKSAWGYKNKQDGRIPSDGVLEVLWVNTASLYPEFSKVCAVSLAYLNPEGNLVCKEFYGEDEKGLLQSLAITLNKMVAHDKEYRLIGHASKFFDYPFMAKRYIINRLDIPLVLDPIDNKPWLQTNLCTNELWKMGGTTGSSLQAMCTALNIPISKVDLVGDEVGAAFYRGEFKRISTYCALDTIATFNVLRVMKQEDVFEFDDVIYFDAFGKAPIGAPVVEVLPKVKKAPVKRAAKKVEVVNDAPKEAVKTRKPRVKKAPVRKSEGVNEGVKVKSEGVKKEAAEVDDFKPRHILDRIHKSPKMSDDEKSELEILLKRKKILPADRAMVREILVRLYVNTEMFKADKKEIVDAKELEIDELLNKIG